MTTEQRHDLLQQRRERYEEETHIVLDGTEKLQKREQRLEARRACEKRQRVVAAEPEGKLDIRYHRYMY